VYDTESQTSQMWDKTQRTEKMGPQKCTMDLLHKEKKNKERKLTRLILYNQFT